MTEPRYVVDPLISAEEIAARITRLAKDIEARIDKDEPLLVVGVLRGSFVFVADLVRALDRQIEVDFMEISSYGSSTTSSRNVRILKDLRTDIENKTVLVVEDIVDTGHTLARLLNLLGDRNPRQLYTVTLLDKPSRREVAVTADWIGFEVPDAFIVGYGIDYAQRERNLSYLGEVRFLDE